jgi:hypothetical protein
MDQSTNFAAFKKGSNTMGENEDSSGRSYFLIKAQWYKNTTKAVQQEYLTVLPR